jgi:hypothetical protein
MTQPIAQLRTVPRPLGRAMVLLLSLAVAAGALAAATPVLAAGGDGLRREANKHRVAHDLNPVVGTALLDDIATRRAGQMVAAGKLEHNFDYVSNRLNSSGVCWTGFGEIIAWNYGDYSYSGTMAQWWDSKDHHKIIMTADYNAAGGAWQKASDGGNYSVMIFAELCSGIAQSSVHVLRPDVKYDPDRKMVFRAGWVTGYHLSAGGAVLGKKIVRFGSTARATAAGRARVNGKAWLKVSSGPFAGYWVHESPDSFVRGMTQRSRFDPERDLVVQPDTYLGLKFDWLGRVTASRKQTYRHKVHMGSGSRAIINGRPYYLFGSGALDGYWVRDTSQIDFT